jgi:hypothetical protein
MGLKAIFERKRQQWRDRSAAKLVYEVLIAAINRQSLDEVKSLLSALDAPTKAIILKEFMPHPTKQAFIAGNPQVFAAVLEAMEASDRYMIEKQGETYIYRSMLFSAIENSQSDLALCLIRHKGTDLEHSGQRPGDPFISPIAMARKMGLTQVNIELAERMAARHRKVADELTQEANSLRGVRLLGLPSAPKPGPIQDL